MKEFADVEFMERCQLHCDALTNQERSRFAEMRFKYSLAAVAEIKVSLHSLIHVSICCVSL